MRGRVWVWGFVGALAVGAGVVAQTPIPVVPVLPPRLQEDLTGRLMASEAEVVGLTGGTLVGAVGPLEAVVSGIRVEDATIRVHVTKVDGSYSATFNQPNPKKGSTLRLKLQSAAASKASGAPGEYAISARASRGAACDGKSPYLPARWPAQKPETGYTLLFNSPKRVEVQMDGDLPRTCRPMATALGRAQLVQHSFNYACALPKVAATPKCGAPTQVHYLTSDGSADDAKEITLRGGC